jgi:hypothetical protein
MRFWDGKKIRIRDKHTGSATLVSKMKLCITCSTFSIKKYNRKDICLDVCLIYFFLQPSNGGDCRNKDLF